MDTKLYKFQHYDINDFSLFLNGKQYLNDGLSLGMDHEKTSVMGYRILFEGSGIHHSNAGNQITHDMFVNGYFMLLLISQKNRAILRSTSPIPNRAISGWS